MSRKPYLLHENMYYDKNRRTWHFDMQTIRLREGNEIPMPQNGTLKPVLLNILKEYWTKF